MGNRQAEGWMGQVLDTVCICAEDWPLLPAEWDEWVDAWWSDWDDLFIGPRPPSYIGLRAWVRECLRAWAKETQMTKEQDGMLSQITKTLRYHLEMDGVTVTEAQARNAAAHLMLVVPEWREQLRDLAKRGPTF